ncbi:MAG: phosphoribosylanthranilate isomerase [Desulfovibrionales bacterium]
MRESRKTTLVKVCGMTTAEDATLCARLGADLVGFIFHRSSPRNITPARAAAIPSFGMIRVGVFVQQSVDEVLAIMNQARLDMAQLHGDQDESFCKGVGPEQVIRVFWPGRYSGQGEFRTELSRFARCCTYALLDAGTSGGGHGTSMDLSLLHDISIPMPWFLAGGLGPDTIGPALSHCSPQGVDLNSGVESSPGKKDEKKLCQTLEKVRSSDPSHVEPTLD